MVRARTDEKTDVATWHPVHGEAPLPFQGRGRGRGQMLHTSVPMPRLVALLCCAAILVTGCVSNSSPGSGQTSSAGNASPGAPKVLRIAMQAQAEPVEGMVAILSST